MEDESNKSLLYNKLDGNILSANHLRLKSWSEIKKNLKFSIKYKLIFCIYKYVIYYKPKSRVLLEIFLLNWKIIVIIFTIGEFFKKEIIL